MENKELATSGKITGELIGGWLLWGIVFGIVYKIIFNIISSITKSIILQVIFIIILEGIIAFLMWKLSTSSTFKKRTMLYDDVSKVMRNLVIFTIVVCVIMGVYNFSRFNTAINKSLESNYGLKMSERIMLSVYNEEQMNEYNEQKEEAIQKSKKQLYLYFTILEIGVTVVYLAVLPLEKKEILKYIE